MVFPFGVVEPAVRAWMNFIEFSLKDKQTSSKHIVQIFGTVLDEHPATRVSAAVSDRGRLL
jgi:non-ribosomal peptide synthetase component E (peptide arylation enzyme)